MSINIMIVEDDPFWQKNIREELEEEEDLNVVCVATNKEEAVQSIGHVSIDVILMDINLTEANLDGIDAAKEIHSLQPSIKIIVLTSLTDKEIILDAMDNGAVNFITKSNVADIITAIREAHNERPNLHADAAVVLIEEFKRLRQTDSLNLLTDRNFQQVNESTLIASYESLFTSIKEQRHDFNNHVSTIYALATLGEYSQLKNYTKDIVDEISSLNDIIHINYPILSALIIAAISKAKPQNVIFNYEIEDMSKLKNSSLIESTDLVKIISNLIDNGIDAALESKGSANPFVSVKGVINGSYVIFDVSNNGPIIPYYLKDEIFATGFSSKENGSGLGLGIVKKIIDKYKGTLQIESTEKRTSFRVKLKMELI